MRIYLHVLNILESKFNFSFYSMEVLNSISFKISSDFKNFLIVTSDIKQY